MYLPGALESEAKQVNHFLNKIDGLIEHNLQKLTNQLKQLEEETIEIPFTLTTQVTDSTLPTQEMDWSRIQKEALDRGSTECPICLVTFQSLENVVITSCSHLFHVKCLNSFEKFDETIFTHKCPCCRQFYERCTLSLC